MYLYIHIVAWTHIWGTMIGVNIYLSGPRLALLSQGQEKALESGPFPG